MTHRLAPLLSRVILVANQKGGVGKSSIVSAMAGMVASDDRSVLVIDADQQGNVSRNDLGVAGDKGRSLAMALQYAQPLEPVRDVRPGLNVIPVSYTHLRAHETDSYLVCRLLLEKKKKETHTIAIT